MTQAVICLDKTVKTASVFKTFSKLAWIVMSFWFKICNGYIKVVTGIL